MKLRGATFTMWIYSIQALEFDKIPGARHWCESQYDDDLGDDMYVSLCRGRAPPPGRESEVREIRDNAAFANEIEDALILNIWTTAAYNEPEDHPDPTSAGWCGSYWDTEFGEEVYNKYCRNTTLAAKVRGNKGDRSLAGGPYVHDTWYAMKDGTPEWAIYHHRNNDVYFIPQNSNYLDILGKHQGGPACEGTEDNRPVLKTHHQHFVRFFGQRQDQSKQPLVHLHDVHGTMYFKYVVEEPKSYPCGEPKCGISTSPYGIVTVWTKAGQTECSMWLRITHSISHNYNVITAKNAASYYPGFEICADRDCSRRWTGCPSAGCKQEKVNGVCTATTPSCTNTNAN